MSLFIRITLVCASAAHRGQEARSFWGAKKRGSAFLEPEHPFVSTPQTRSRNRSQNPNPVRVACEATGAGGSAQPRECAWLARRLRISRWRPSRVRRSRRAPAIGGHPRLQWRMKDRRRDAEDMGGDFRHPSNLVWGDSSLNISGGYPCRTRSRYPLRINLSPSLTKRITRDRSWLFQVRSSSPRHPAKSTWAISR
jgi:hypothetical protein